MGPRWPAQHWRIGAICEPALIVRRLIRHRGQKRLETGAPSLSKDRARRSDIDMGQEMTFSDRAKGLLPKPLCAAALALLVGCAPIPELVGIDNPDVPVGSVEGATLKKVFIASTRQETEAAGALFSAARAPELGLASVQVSIPPTHEIGELERPSYLPPDPRTEFAVVDPVVYNGDRSFINAVNAELRKRPPGKRNVLFFVHGYNNTTSDAILRLAQFSHDTGFEGVPVLFDWASAASVTRYVYDLNSALIARPKIPEISQIMLNTQAEGIDIFAHSMGSFLTMEAIKDASLTGRFNRYGRLNSITLASPDIDMDLFRSQLSQINLTLDRFYVLLSEDDSALRFSRRLAGGVPRVGAADIDELSDLGVTAIDLSEVDNSKSGSHSKFAGSPEVVQLIGNGLNSANAIEGRARNRTLREMIGEVPITIAFE